MVYVDDVLIGGHYASDVTRLHREATRPLQRAGHAARDETDAADTTRTPGVEQTRLPGQARVSSKAAATGAGVDPREAASLDEPAA